VCHACLLSSVVGSSNLQEHHQLRPAVSRNARNYFWQPLCHAPANLRATYGKTKSHTLAGGQFELATINRKSAGIGCTAPCKKACE